MKGADNKGRKSGKSGNHANNSNGKKYLKEDAHSHKKTGSGPSCSVTTVHADYARTFVPPQGYATAEALIGDLTSGTDMNVLEMEQQFNTVNSGEFKVEDPSVPTNLETDFASSDLNMGSFSIPVQDIIPDVSLSTIKVPVNSPRKGFESFLEKKKLAELKKAIDSKGPLSPLGQEPTLETVEGITSSYEDRWIVITTKNKDADIGAGFLQSFIQALSLAEVPVPFFISRYTSDSIYIGVEPLNTPAQIDRSSLESGLTQTSSGAPVVKLLPRQQFVEKAATKKDGSTVGYVALRQPENVPSSDEEDEIPRKADTNRHHKAVGHHKESSYTPRPTYGMLELKPKKGNTLLHYKFKWNKYPEDMVRAQGLKAAIRTIIRREKLEVLQGHKYDIKTALLVGHPNPYEEDKEGEEEHEVPRKSVKKDPPQNFSPISKTETESASEGDCDDKNMEEFFEGTDSRTMSDDEFTHRYMDQ